MHHRAGSSASSRNYPQASNPTSPPGVGSDTYNRRQSVHYTPQGDLLRSPTSPRLGPPTSPPSSFARPSSARPVRIPRAGLDEGQNADLEAQLQRFSINPHRRRSQDATPPGSMRPPLGSKRHSVASGVVDECDQTNRFVLLNAQRQLAIQTGETGRSDLRAPVQRGEDYSRAAAWEQTKNQLIYGSGPSSEPRQKHGLLLSGGSWQMTGKAGVAASAAPSPALAATSMASAHIISPSSSRSYSSGGSYPSPSAKYLPVEQPLAPGSNPPADAQSEAGSSSRRLSLPGQPPARGGANRNRSSTLAAAPGLLDTIFQRIRTPQQVSPETPSSSLALTDEDLQTYGMSDAQLLQHHVTKDWAHRPGDSSRATSPAPTPTAGLAGTRSHPPGTSFTGSGPPCRGSRHAQVQDGRACLSGDRGHGPPGRFIHQIIFSFGDAQKNCLQAILVLRRLTHGLPNRSGPSRGGVLPIPRIMQRYPSSRMDTVTVPGGRQLVAVKYDPPYVQIEWSDEVKDQFDPTGLSCDQILARCHFFRS